MTSPRTYPNPDLVAGDDNKSTWNHPDRRRWGFHNLPRIARYTMSFRAREVLRLSKAFDLAIADMQAVRHLTSLPAFSAMIVLQGERILYEKYAADFRQDSVHSIQSITKTFMHLVIGRLVAEAVIDVTRPVRDYLPEVGSGYADATVQQVLNMDVVNDYSEDFTDPEATYYAHEEAMGWRLPRDPEHELTQRNFVMGITSDRTFNSTGVTQYKDANTDILALIAEKVTGKPMRAFLADIADAAGIEGALHITTDREGFPTVDGGACLSARDLARYMLIFVRKGLGVQGTAIGDAGFLEASLGGGIPMPPVYGNMRYSNHLMVCGSAVGHSGWAGQNAIVDLETGVAGVYFGVAEDAHACHSDHSRHVREMLMEIARRGA